MRNVTIKLAIGTVPNDGGKVTLENEIEETGNLRWERSSLHIFLRNVYFRGK